MKSKQLLYRQEIVRHFYFAGSLSCTEISTLTRKSLPLITRLVNEMVEEGALVETGLASSTGGRRPQMYALHADLMYLVSVAMDQFITRIAIVDMQNNYVHGVEEVQLKLHDNPASLRQLGERLQEFLGKSGIPKGKIAGIGIGMPGFVDVHKGVNHSHLAPPPGESIVSYLEGLTRLPVFIDNDSSLIALAESRFGAGHERQNVMVVNISWGIGLGMILNGRLFRGDSGFAGELSHIPVFNNNKLCACGKYGCLETEASLVVMVEKAIEGLAGGQISQLQNLSLDNLEASADQIMTAAINGDRFAVELLGNIGYNIGRGIAVLIHILNPGLVVLSGRGALAGKLWLAPIQQAINELCIPKIAENTSITISSLGKHAELIGGAALVMEKLETIQLPIYPIQSSKILS